MELIFLYSRFNKKYQVANFTIDADQKVTYDAIVFGSGLLTIPKMAKAGFLLNLVGIVVVSTVAVTLAPRFLN